MILAQKLLRFPAANRTTQLTKQLKNGDKSIRLWVGWYKGYCRFVSRHFRLWRRAIRRLVHASDAARLRDRLVDPIQSRRLGRSAIVTIENRGGTASAHPSQTVGTSPAVLTRQAALPRAIRLVPAQWHPLEHFVGVLLNSIG